MKDAKWYFKEWNKSTPTRREMEETNNYKDDCPWCDERIDYIKFFKEHPEVERRKSNG